MPEKEPWYSNKDLYEMMVDLSKKLETLGSELDQTRTLIRDYNGLRERLGKCESRLDLAEGKDTGSKNMWGYVIGALGVLLALISFAIK